MAATSSTSHGLAAWFAGLSLVVHIQVKFWFHQLDMVIVMVDIGLLRTWGSIPSNKR